MTTAFAGPVSPAGTVGVRFSSCEVVSRCCEYNAGMSDKRPKSWRPIWIAVAICLFLLAAYVAGYAYTGTVEESPLNLAMTYRTYHTRFECRMFYPLGWLEAKSRGRTVVVSSPSRYYDLGWPEGKGSRFVFQP